MAMREVRKQDLPFLAVASRILWQTGHPGIASAVEEVIENADADPKELLRAVDKKAAARRKKEKAG